MGWRPPALTHFGRCDVAGLQAAVAQLRQGVGFGLLTPAQMAQVEAASQRIMELMEQLGYGPTVWGAVHGDLHQGNLLFYGAQACAIDYSGCQAHYLYDLGVTLYHLFYQEVSIRRALIEGYHQIFDRLALPDEQLDAFMTAAAIANNGFQMTIPGHRESALNLRNLHQLTDLFCVHLVNNVPLVFG
jgi:Ser/Thr protein kinase RdoA (MazF antagonist)